MHAIKALEALAQAFGRELDMAMVDMVLEDSLIRDLLEDAVDPAQRGGLDGSAMRLKAATPVLASVSPLTLHQPHTCQQLDTIRYCIFSRASPSQYCHIAREWHIFALEWHVCLRI